LHFIGCTYLILHNFYFELCVLVEQTNITQFYLFLVMLMEMELDIVLNQTSFKLFVKMIGIEDF
jgi:hypothetical protein